MWEIDCFLKPIYPKFLDSTFLIVESLIEKLVATACTFLKAYNYIFCLNFISLIQKGIFLGGY